MRFPLIYLICQGIVLSGCSQGSTPAEQKKTPTMSESFGAPADQGESNNLIAIQKSALGQEYLLQASIAEQRGYGSHISNPTSYGLKSRIVLFERHGENLVMLEANEGSQPGKELEAHALITTFPIEKVEGEILTCDFNEGMRHVPLAWDWYVSDYFGNNIKPDFVLAAASSYLRELKILPDALSIVQTLSAELGSYLFPMEITYYLTRYQPNPNYKPVDFPDLNHLGYFEANPRVQEGFGTPYTYITRWDISKPVTYYISRAVPEKYRQAVREGILYWNRAFGKEVLRAELAPVGVSAPNFQHNVIQWHTDYLTGAYADAQMDPRTGEILHSQIFISSSFTEVFLGRILPRWERELEDKQRDGENDITYLRAREFRDSRLCEISVEDFLKAFHIYREMMEALPEGRVDTLSRDLLRSVVAHEVGHTLGLRHNFAASTINEWDGAFEDGIIRRYIQSGELPNDFQPPIASVMDYPNLAGDVLAGVRIGRSEGEVLPYDKYAIEWGYFGADKRPTNEGIPFCTDSHADSYPPYQDCYRWDAGGHLVERRAYQTERRFENIPRLLSETYLAAKADFNPRWRRPVKESTPSASFLTESVVLPFRDLYSLFTEDVRLLSLERKFPDLIEADLEKLGGETLQWLDSEIDHAGGIRRILRIMNPKVFQERVGHFSERLEKILASESYQNTALPEGGTASFTEDELNYIRERAMQLFPQVEEELAHGISSTFFVQPRVPFPWFREGETAAASPPGLAPPRVVPLRRFNQIDKLEATLAEWAEYLIVTGQNLDSRYSLNTRRIAVDLLHSPGPKPTWLDEFIAPIAEKLKRRLEEGLGIPLEKVDVEKFPENQRQKIMDELSIYYALVGPPDATLEIPVSTPHQ